MPKRRLIPDGKSLVAGAKQLCLGTRIAYGRNRDRCKEPHEVGISWGNCHRCNRPLGCSVCVTSNEREVLCEPCGMWGTKAAFLHHGPVEYKPAKHGRWKPALFAAYPENWRREYEPPQVAGRFDETVVHGLVGEKTMPPLTHDPRAETAKDWE
jgi:hypothetical protein